MHAESEDNWMMIPNDVIGTHTQVIVVVYV
jgi:hypothetical protein